MTGDVHAPRYTRPWVVTVLLLVCFIAYSVWHAARLRRPVHLELPPPEERPQVDWFQIVRLPELPPDKEDARRRAEELRAWLTLFERDGLVNMTLSDAVSRLSNGGLVPEGSVVLLYDPGYRYTYEAAVPVLEDLGTRIVWITNDPGIHTTDRRFVTRHDRRLLDENGTWDSGLREGEGFSFILEEDSAARAGRSVMQWARPNGAYGINNRETLDALERLNANPRWSPEEIIARLMAEWPVRRATCLTAVPIQGRLWGTLPRPGREQSCAFDLVCPPDKRTATVSWSGTRGLCDYDVELEVGELFGELWVLLRSDRETGQRLRVGVDPEGVRVQAENLAGTRDLAVLRDPSVCAGGVHIRIALRRDELVVTNAADGKELVSVPVNVPCGPAAVVELVLYDRVAGAAHASNVHLHLTPGGPG